MTVKTFIKLIVGALVLLAVVCAPVLADDISSPVATVYDKNMENAMEYMNLQQAFSNAIDEGYIIINTDIECDGLMSKFEAREVKIRSDVSRTIVCNGNFTLNSAWRFENINFIFNGGSIICEDSYTNRRNNCTFTNCEITANNPDGALLKNRGFMTDLEFVNCGLTSSGQGFVIDNLDFIEWASASASILRLNNSKLHTEKESIVLKGYINLYTNNSDIVSNGATTIYCENVSFKNNISICGDSENSVNYALGTSENMTADCTVKFVNSDEYFPWFSIRNMDVRGTGTGIDFENAHLSISNCTFDGFVDGIKVKNMGRTQLFCVNDTTMNTLRNCILAVDINPHMCFSVDNAHFVSAGKTINAEGITKRIQNGFFSELDDALVSDYYMKEETEGGYNVVPVPFTVTYELDGEVYATEQHVREEIVTILPKAEKEGYIVSDWTTENLWIDNGTFYMPERDVTFTATSEVDLDYVAPIVEEPVAEVVVEPTPVIEEPIVEEIVVEPTVEPTVETTVETTVEPTLVVEESIVEEPVVEDIATVEPTVTKSTPKSSNSVTSFHGTSYDGNLELQRSPVITDIDVSSGTKMSATIQSAPAGAYYSVKLTSENANGQEMTVHFTVALDEIKIRGHDVMDVVLIADDTECSTTILENNGTYAKYSAPCSSETKELIVGFDNGKTLTPVVEVPVEPVVETVNEVECKPVKTTEVPKSAKSPAPIIGVLIGLGVCALVLRRK